MAFGERAVDGPTGFEAAGSTRSRVATPGNRAENNCKIERLEELCEERDIMGY